MSALPQRLGVWVLASASAALLFLVSVSPLSFSMRSIHEATGQQLLDVVFAYDVHTGMGVVRDLGVEGRHAYLLYIPFDAVFACCYGSLFATLMLRSVQGPVMTRLAIGVPLTTAVADLGEGAAVAVALLRHPEESPGAIRAASALGVAKHIGFWSSLAGVIVSAIVTHLATKGRVLP